MSAAAGPSPIVVRVDYDFASSLCYVAHRCMQRLAEQVAALGITLRWSPLDLTLLTGWRRGAELDPERRHHVERVASELGVPVRVPRVWLDSRAAHAVALCLDADREPTWREAVFSTVFESGRWPDEDCVAGLARQLGIEVEARALERAQERLTLRTREAHAEEVSGVPNFMLGAWPFGGIQTDDTMLSILSRFAAREREREREGAAR